MHDEHITEDRRGWHLDKGIPIAVILSFIVIAVGFMKWLAEQDNRIGNIEVNVQHLQQARINDQVRAEKKFDELKTDLRLINGKLDRLIEGRRQ